jgi:hypothetical protein
MDAPPPWKSTMQVSLYPSAMATTPFGFDPTSRAGAAASNRCGSARPL